MREAGMVNYCVHNYGGSAMLQLYSSAMNGIKAAVNS